MIPLLVARRRFFETRRATNLKKGARRERMRSIAEGMRHEAIPQREAHHMCVTMHHGHSQGCQKSKGDKAMCAHCLASGTRVEETSTHVHQRTKAGHRRRELAFGNDASTSDAHIRDRDVRVVRACLGILPTGRGGGHRRESGADVLKGTAYRCCRCCWLPCDRKDRQLMQGASGRSIQVFVSRRCIPLIMGRRIIPLFGSYGYRF